MIPFQSPWHLDSSPGAGAPGVLQKCGNLFPSLGTRGTGLFSPSSFGPVSDAGRSMIAPGTVIPSSGPSRASLLAQVFVLQTAYFNGYSAVYRFPLVNPGLHAPFSLSVWLWVDQYQGTLIQGGLPGSGTPNFPLPGTGGSLFEWSSIIGADVNDNFPTLGEANDLFGQWPVGSLGGDGAWTNLLVSYDAVSAQNIYFNDTPIYSPNVIFPAASVGIIGLQNSGTPCTFLTIGSPHAFAGNFVQLPPPNYAFLGFTGADPLRPQGDGLKAGITEFWCASGQYIDFSIQANRRKFNCTDAGLTAYAPVDLGTHGQTPTGTKPDVYLTGNPFQWGVNRANGMKTQVYNALNANTFFNPTMTTLDPLPPYIGPPT